MQTPMMLLEFLVKTLATMPGLIPMLMDLNTSSDGDQPRRLVLLPLI